MKRLLTLLLALGMFANSQAQVVECIDPSLIDPFGFCPLIFSPVCGCDGIDYSNSCVGQKSAGITDWFPTPFITCAQIQADCLAPARNLTTDVSAGSIVFEWDYPIGNAAIAYRVRGRVAGTSAWANGPVVTASFPSTTFSLPTSVLSSGTTYEWQVQTSCAPLGANVAPESASGFFTAPGARMADDNGFAIYPNPATDILNLSYMTTESATYTYQVVDMMGKLHMTGTLDLEGGMQQTTLDVSELGVGMFTLVLESGETKLVERFYHEK